MLDCIFWNVLFESVNEGMSCQFVNCKSFIVSFKEHISKNTIQQKSTNTEHLTNHSHNNCSDISKNVEITEIIPKSHKKAKHSTSNSMSKKNVIYCTYKAHKTELNKLLNDQFNYQSIMIFDTFINSTNKNKQINCKAIPYIVKIYPCMEPRTHNSKQKLLQYSNKVKVTFTVVVVLVKCFMHTWIRCLSGRISDCEWSNQEFKQGI